MNTLSNVKEIQRMSRNKHDQCRLSKSETSGLSKPGASMKIESMNRIYFHYLRESVLENGVEVTRIQTGLPDAVLEKIVKADMLQLESVVDKMRVLLVQPIKADWKKLLDEPEVVSDLAIMQSLS